VVLHAIMELILCAPTTAPALLSLLEQGVIRILENYPRWHEAYRAGRIGRPRAAPGPAYALNSCFLARDAARLPIDAGQVWESVLGKLKSGDRLFVLDYLAEARFVALDAHRPLLALRLLEPLVLSSNASTRHALADLLGRLVPVVPEDVRNLLERGNSPALTALVSAHTRERPTHHWLYFRLEEWIFPYLSGHRLARHLIAEILAEAAQSTSVQEAVERGLECMLRALKEPVD